MSGKVIFKEDTPLRFRVDSDSESEEVEFEKGEEAQLVQEFPTHFLVKCELGHFYNVKKDLVTVVG